MNLKPWTVDRGPRTAKAPPHTARFLAGAADPAQLPTFHYPEVAFAGRSNVGKSSLLNRLVRHSRLARVGRTPGRTQQINFFLIDERCTFVDLPGYGFARVPASLRQQWKRLVETYLSRRATLRAVVVIVDLRRGVEDDDAALLDYLHAYDIPVILVATKADKLRYGERLRRAQMLATTAFQGVAAVVICSAVSGEGVERLWEEISARVQGREHSRAPG
jgi:GTP-binding protein